MAHYLVTATPLPEGLPVLRANLRKRKYRDMQPFGRALTHALHNARIRDDGRAVWEEEDYCTPPLAEERAAALDEFFDDLTVESVEKGKGWEAIRGLPHLFPELAGNR